MNVMDPGHEYALAKLDWTPENPSAICLRFVKREGPKYPGNVGHYPGTTVQEVLRACVDRLAYVNKQEYSDLTDEARDCCIDAICLLEDRAARRHGRPGVSEAQALYGECCPKCNHVGYKGECH